jgi:PTH1 family peptidyl-tRNA hydrolase
MILDELARHWETYETDHFRMQKKFNAVVAGYKIKGEPILLLKPQTFMNASGESVKLAGSFYKVPSRNIIVVHDDKDIPLGEIKVQADRGHGGHNGVRSIIDQIGTKAFIRVRVGVAAPGNKKMDDTASFVLGKFSFLEKRTLQSAIRDSIAHIEQLIQTLEP